MTLRHPPGPAAPIRVLIVDDEPLARAALRHLAARHRDAVVVGEAGDGASALRLAAEVSPDVVLIDVEMPGGNGVEIVRRWPTTPRPLVVFVTAYSEFAAQGFEVDAVDYLVKPFSDERFDEAFARVQQRRAGRPAARTHLLVPAGDRRLLVPLADISHIVADDYYASVPVAGKFYLLRQSLTQLERDLAPSGFVRLHRSALVNLAAIRALHRGPSGGVVAVLADGTRLGVSRARRGPLEAALRALTGEA